MSFVDVGVMTPYSTVMPLIGADLATWVPEEDQERISSYTKYDEIYWNHSGAFKLVHRGLEDRPIYIPEPRTIVDSTAHFLLKGLKIQLDGIEPADPRAAVWMGFLKREKFYTRFHTAKHAGVARGDYVLHIVADPAKPTGTRVSFTTVDPASYFPEADDNDPDKIIAVNLVEQFMLPDLTVKLKVQRYEYGIVSGRRRVFSTIEIVDVEQWWNPKERQVQQVVMSKKMLPDTITTIPVYHFKNIDWDGQPFGSSELRGHERLFSAINQSISDEEMALALEGLGVYATDAGSPENEDGEEEDWVIAPAKVLELPAGSTFRRVEGVGSVQPMQDHIGYITDALYRATATFEPGKIDVSVAESGIALAIKFLPTLAKTESRDNEGVSTLEQFCFDLKGWFRAYENTILVPDFLITLGEKLPPNRVAQLNELNNMLDRKIVSRKWYRTQMRLFGYEIPEAMETEVLEEERLLSEARVFQSTDEGDPQRNNNSNNKDRPNESAGTEADNGSKSARQREQANS